MKKLLLAAAATAATLMMSAQASAASFPITVAAGTNYFGNTVGAGDFTDTFTFTLPQLSLGSSAVITISNGALQDIDLDTVDLNGMFFTPTITPLPGNLDALETFTLASTNLVAGPYTITVKGSSNGVASYSGTLNLAAVPEPATWAMMIAGFGLVGGAMRRRNAVRTVFA